MILNRKIERWLKVGKKRFAEEGGLGIHINEMNAAIGVAKTSFYFFFKNNKEYLEQLFTFCELESIDRLFAKVKHIKNPVKRFYALGTLVEKNLENEAFYIQMKTYALKNEHARKFLDNVYQKKLIISSNIFKELGQSEEESMKNGLKMRMFFCGRMAMKIGYNPNIESPDLTGDEFIEMFGLKT